MRKKGRMRSLILMILAIGFGMVMILFMLLEVPPEMNPNLIQIITISKTCGTPLAVMEIVLGINGIRKS